jgi:sigma-E factor negative regulatory protein RseA
MGQAQMHSIYVKEAAEQISVLIDGELGRQEVDAALDLAKSDAGMREWVSFQLIGDTLRSEDLLNSGPTDDFVSRFASRFESEPFLFAPVIMKGAPGGFHRFSSSWMRRVVPGTAIAAAVAAVSWVAIPQMRGAGQAGAPDVVARVAPAAVPKIGNVVTVGADASQMIRDPRLDEYLRAHRVSVSTNAVVPTLRNVADGASFSQDNTQE